MDTTQTSHHNQRAITVSTPKGTGLIIERGGYLRQVRRLFVEDTLRGRGARTMSYTTGIWVDSREAESIEDQAIRLATHIGL